MGLIKEPKGVDFIIKSKPLTDEERIAISEYIRSYKAKGSRRFIKQTKNKKLQLNQQPDTQ